MDNKIKELLNAKRPVTLGTIARELGLSALETAKRLPQGMASFAPGAAFDHIWESLSRWDKATFILEHMGNVIEVSTKVACGKHAMGYYNIMGGKAPLEGHFKADAVDEIAMISMPFMGRESHFVAFFNHSGEMMYSFYVGREKHELIASAKEAFLQLKAQYETPKTLIVYSSRTGNTKKIANAICQGIPLSHLCSIDEAPDTAQFENIFVGFWIDKGVADEKAKNFLSRLEGKTVALFGTMGGNPQEERARAFVEKFERELKESLPGNTYRPLFMCQGKVDPQIIEAMNQMLGEKAQDPARLERLNAAAQHPDEHDLKAALQWAKACLDD